MTIVFMVSTIAGSFEYGQELGGTSIGDDVEEELKELSTAAGALV